MTPGSEQIAPWPRRPASLATAVIEDLVDRIVSGQFPAGSTLPTEPVLCERFGVSRGVLREAIKALASMRLVRVQQGQGTTALPQSSWDLADPVVLAAVVRHDDDLTILDHLVEVRRALEARMASAAATHLTTADVAAIDERLAILEQSVSDPDGYTAADVAFHDAILTASGNLLGRAIITTLTVEAYRSLRYIGVPTDKDRRLSNVAHRAIRDAVVEGRAADAAALMDHHIVEAWERRKPVTGRRTLRQHP